MMRALTYGFLDSPLGPIALVASGRVLVGLHFEDDARIPSWAVRDDAALEPALRQLAEYFAGTRRTFDLALEPVGTGFRMRVWQALREIPYGATRSYVDVARQLGNPKATRAVGGANHHNPLAIVIPCHRVIGRDGGLTGYGGGLDRKRWLLEHEQATCARAAHP